MDRHTLLLDTFVVLADTLVKDFDLTEFLGRLATTCVELLEVAAAGILLAGPDGQLQVVGSSDDRMRLLELFELQNEQGPCMDCHATGRPVAEADLRTSGRWPDFAARAVAEGFVAVEALPLRLRDDQIGALNLFSRTAGGLAADQRNLAQALADVASIGLVQQRAIRESELLAEQLQHALTSRVAIEQAKGVLAEQGAISVGEAFEVLRTRARHTGVAVEAVARQVIDGTHTLDDLRT